MYHRFVLTNAKPYPENTGVLAYASGVWADNLLPSKEEDTRLGVLIRWFNHHVQVSPWLTKSDEEIFWFKDHKGTVEQMIRLCEFITNHTDEQTSHIIASELGTVVYEDRMQIVAASKRRKWHVEQEFFAKNLV